MTIAVGDRVTSNEGRTGRVKEIWVPGDSIKAALIEDDSGLEFAEPVWMLTKVDQ